MRISDWSSDVCSSDLRSADKFDSGTGWPSFVRPIKGNVGTSIDKSWFITRTEVHSRRCGGHLRHVLDDGPPPTGQRHCINGDALEFVAPAGHEKSHGGDRKGCE